MNTTGTELRQRIAKDFWPRLRRELTHEKLKQAAYDSKAGSDQTPRIYVPYGSAYDEAFAYYSSDPSLTVERLVKKEDFTNDLLYKVAHEPGLLSLAFENGAPLPYLVPGGRFNEFYGWDSYFIALGLIQDENWEDAAIVATQFAFEITAYNRIMNANRSYYLGRSHPPFLTDLAWRLQKRFPDKFVNWMLAAIQEYNNVWTASPRYDEETGLSRYSAEGRGIPPEVEPGQFDDVLKPLAERYGLSVDEFSRQYNNEQLKVPELDEFLRHDRAVRESGHDVTSRFYNICADLATIDLTSLLYKYEVDIARAVKEFPDAFPNESYETWNSRAARRRKALETYHWDEKNGRFCDYNLVKRELHAPCTTATTLWPLWSGCATAEQAEAIVRLALPEIEFEGGLSSTSKLPDDGRQWDYPAGWAPHQILAWEGLENYGFHDDARRLARGWLNSVQKAFTRSDGAVFEKLDVTGVDDPQDVRSEYGNQGDNQTGFGWTNTSFVLGWDKYGQN